MKIPWPDCLPPVEEFYKHPGVRHVQHGKLVMFTYTDKQNFSGVWDDVTMNARGLVADTDGNLVAWPFPKFFNAGQKATVNCMPWVEPSDPADEVYEKYDGSLIIHFWYDDVPYFVTRGSFDSDQARMARQLVSPMDYEEMMVDDTTAMFELVGPSNQHTIVYDEDDLIPLAYRTGTGPIMFYNVPGQTSPYREGWVYVYPDGTMVKHKTPYYVAAAKAAATNLTEAWVSRTHNDVLVQMTRHDRKTATEHICELDCEYGRTLMRHAFAMDDLPSDASRSTAADFIKNHEDIENSIGFALADYRGIGTIPKNFDRVDRAIRKVVAARFAPFRVRAGASE